jgi:hypothetical protein
MESAVDIVLISTVGSEISRKKKIIEFILSFYPAPKLMFVWLSREAEILEHLK